MGVRYGNYCGTNFNCRFIDILVGHIQEHHDIEKKREQEARRSQNKMSKRFAKLKQSRLS